MAETDLKELLFTYEGRVNRAKWWAVHIGISVAIFVFIGIVLILLSISDVLGVIGWIAFVIFTIGTLVTEVFVNIKRWHDRGKSGWWVLIAFVPLIGGIWVLIECGFLIGDGETNQYGPDPLANL